MSSTTIPCRKFTAQVMISALVLLLVAGCSDKETTSMEEAAPVQAPAPQVAEPEVPPAVMVTETVVMPDEPQAASSAAPDDEPQAASVDGQKIYQASCQSCHAAGVAGAPKLGDKEAWAPRIAKGKDALLMSVTNGLNVMPPKGTCMSCSDEELSAAVDYMVEQGS